MQFLQQKLWLKIWREMLLSEKRMFGSYIRETSQRNFVLSKFTETAATRRKKWNHSPQLSFIKTIRLRSNVRRRTFSASNHFFMFSSFSTLKVRFANWPEKNFSHFFFFPSRDHSVKQQMCLLNKSKTQQISLAIIAPICTFSFILSQLWFFACWATNNTTSMNGHLFLFYCCRLRAEKMREKSFDSITRLRFFF